MFDRLFVDAADEDANRFYEHFGFASLPSDQMEVFLPVATILAALARH